MAQMLFKLGVLLVALVTVWTEGLDAEVVGLHLPEPRQWMGWKAKFHKTYSTFDEDFEKRAVWTKNQQTIDEHNKQYDIGRRSFRVAMNEFGDQDWTSIRRPIVHNEPTNKRPVKAMPDAPSSSTSLPPSWDWRVKGAVLPVQNQGMVDSALAINTADAVSSFSFIHDATSLDKLSVQEVVDCCLPDPIVSPTVFDCIHTAGGLCMSGTYHSASGPNPCNSTACKAVAYVDHGGKKVTQFDEIALMFAAVTTPVVVAIDASQPSFQFYSSGVYSDPKCSQTKLDHVMLVVGYGFDKASQTEYWLCRNSWGSSWGEEGYIRIARMQNNMCGIATFPIYPY